jgi:hypothetical protein
MDTTIIVALISGVAMVTAAAIAIIPMLRGTEGPGPTPEPQPPAGSRAGGARTVYYLGTQYRFLNFGGNNSRIEPLAGLQSFLAPTHELFHDSRQTQRITRETIVVNP